MEFTVFCHLETIVVTFAKKIIAKFVIQYFITNQAHDFFDLYFLLKL